MQRVCFRDLSDNNKVENKRLFTWREEDPSTRKFLEGETTFRLVYMQKFRSGWLLKIKQNYRPLAAELPAAAMFVFLSLVLGFSEVSYCLHGARIFLSLS